jgi:hypothetical protein
MLTEFSAPVIDLGRPGSDNRATIEGVIEVADNESDIDGQIALLFPDNYRTAGDIAKRQVTLQAAIEYAERDNLLRRERHAIVRLPVR